MPLLRSPEAFRIGDERPRRERWRAPMPWSGSNPRGFLFAAPLALHWNVPFVPAAEVRQLPGKTVRSVLARVRNASGSGAAA